LFWALVKDKPTDIQWVLLFLGRE